MERVEFTKAMKKTHTILVPMMLPIHFQFLQSILNDEGYKVELLTTTGPSITSEGLQHVHNDTCYPALLVIGQMIQALKTGNYNLNHVALALTQTGGGCRASNYIHLLRKALNQAGMPQIPIISVNFSKLEKNSGFRLTKRALVKLLYGFLYGDLLMWLKNQCKPYEMEEGITDALVQTWIETLNFQFQSFSYLRLKHNMKEILYDFAQLPRHTEKKIKVGIVGEIYMKYAPLGNNELEEFLIKENCEPVVSGVLDFGLYCIENNVIDFALYGRNKYSHHIAKILSSYIQHLQHIGIKLIKQQGVFQPYDSFTEVKESGEGLIHKGVKMGEGWLLTSEMASLIQNGVNNIVCCQPFGCLPNHIVAKGMSRKLKKVYPNANVVAIDYDPSATKVNQENRLKLMLSNARLNAYMQSEETEEVNHEQTSYVVNTSKS